MEITERLSEGGATPQEIEQLEERVGKRIPNDYRQFLIEHNGGRPFPTAFEGPNGDGSVLDFFFTLNINSPYYWIHQELDMLDGRIPENLLPIAGDSFGNLVLLDCGAKSYGAVYFWEHENENPDGDPWWNNISFISRSFTEFIENLH